MSNNPDESVEIENDAVLEDLDDQDLSLNEEQTESEAVLVKTEVTETLKTKTAEASDAQMDATQPGNG
ncbi:MAG: hypothetical protein P8163_20980 [Candidatus Thiodiazotropha sp.]